MSLASKVLSSEWILRLGSFDRSSLKNEERRFLEKKSAVRHPVRALESYGATSYSRWLFGNKLPTVEICFLIIKNKEALETLKGSHRMGRM